MDALLNTIVLLIIYPYLIYPFLIKVATAGSDSIDKNNIADNDPSVSVILSVYNEEDIIRDKLVNILDANYQLQLLQVLVVSDGSHDRTDEIVESFKDRRVKLIRQGREGKTEALNKAVSDATGDILIFTDANTFFYRDTIKVLIAPFSDENVGLTTGRVITEGVESGEGYFGRFESYLKAKESKLGIISGADGAIYAMRRSLYKPLRPQIINDFFHPVHAQLEGFRCVFVSEALAHEESSADLLREISRQRRMVNQATEILKEILPSVVVRGKWLLCWVLLSHKLSRWIHTPLVMLLLLFATVYSIRDHSHVYSILGSMYVSVYIFCALVSMYGYTMPKILDLAYRFQLIHYAYFLGVLDNLRGKSAVVWNPRGGA